MGTSIDSWPHTQTCKYTKTRELYEKVGKQRQTSSLHTHGTSVTFLVYCFASSFSFQFVWLVKKNKFETIKKEKHLWDFTRQVKWWCESSGLTLAKSLCIMNQTVNYDSRHKQQIQEPLNCIVCGWGGTTVWRRHRKSNSNEDRRNLLN